LLGTYDVLVLAVADFHVVSAADLEESELFSETPELAAIGGDDVAPGLAFGRPFDLGNRECDVSQGAVS
jgi:hypothetical protein